MWKSANLVLLRKAEKPLDQPSSYRPICLLSTMEKLFERVIKCNGNHSYHIMTFLENRATIIIQIIRTLWRDQLIVIIDYQCNK